MRIRKNAKQSPLSHEPLPEALRTNVCQLNQSPWDVIPFPSLPSPHLQQPYLTLSHQFEGDDSLTGNGSLGDYIGAVESMDSMMDAEEKAVINDDNGATKSEKVLDDNEDSKLEDQFVFYDVRREHTLKPCSIHNDEATQYAKKAQKQKQVVIGRSRRERPREAKKRSSSSAANPYEFYYYSGFGPSWRKRRGKAKKDVEEKEVENDGSIVTQNNAAPFGCLQIDDDEEFYYKDNEGNGRKRKRKPIKARSLKSLM